jgi:hypothetical protein
MSEPEFWLTLLAFGAFACMIGIAAAIVALHTMTGGMSGPAPYIPPPPPPEPPKGDAP